MSITIIAHENLRWTNDMVNMHVLQSRFKPHVLTTTNYSQNKYGKKKSFVLIFDQRYLLRERTKESKHFFHYGCGTTLRVQQWAIARRQIVKTTGDGQLHGIFSIIGNQRVDHTSSITQTRSHRGAEFRETKFSPVKII